MQFNIHGQTYTMTKLLELVPTGWETILRQGFEQLFDLGWDGEILQIKEKFGSLRLYALNLTREMDDIVDNMEMQTEQVCSICGAPKTKTSNFWVMHYCDQHYPDEK